jgi:hypothetical protein
MDLLPQAPSADSAAGFVDRVRPFGIRMGVPRLVQLGPKRQRVVTCALAVLDTNFVHAFLRRLNDIIPELVGHGVKRASEKRRRHPGTNSLVGTFVALGVHDDVVDLRLVSRVHALRRLDVLIWSQRVDPIVLPSKVLARFGLVFDNLGLGLRREFCLRLFGLGGLCVAVCGRSEQKCQYDGKK